MGGIMDIGRKIKKKRDEKGYTLKEFSQLCNLSISLVSQVERNLASPSINSLVKMAEVFGCSVGDFFESNERNNDQIIVKKEERRKLSLPQHLTTYELLTPNELDGTVRMVSLTLKPYHYSSTKPFSHSGKEICYTLKGRLKIEFDQSEYELEEGDCISFNSEKAHRFYNPTENDSEFLLVLYDCES
jgi:transcriptional regulator with XRE-family HTH domain